MHIVMESHTFNYVEKTLAKHLQTEVDLTKHLFTSDLGSVPLVQVEMH